MASRLTKRDNAYYTQYMAGKKAKRILPETSSLQLAKKKPADRNLRSMGVMITPSPPRPQLPR